MSCFSKLLYKLRIFAISEILKRNLYFINNYRIMIFDIEKILHVFYLDVETKKKN